MPRYHQVFTVGRLDASKTAFLFSVSKLSIYRYSRYCFLTVEQQNRSFTTGLILSPCSGCQRLLMLLCPLVLHARTQVFGIFFCVFSILLYVGKQDDVTPTGRPDRVIGSSIGPELFTLRSSHFTLLPSILPSCHSPSLMLNYTAGGSSPRSAFRTASGAEWTELSGFDTRACGGRGAGARSP